MEVPVHKDSELYWYNKAHRVGKGPVELRLSDTEVPTTGSLQVVHRGPQGSPTAPPVHSHLASFLASLEGTCCHREHTCTEIIEICINNTTENRLYVLKGMYHNFNWLTDTQLVGGFM